MHQNSDDNDRRILKSPAVRPCESISPSILLADLINLSLSIIHYKDELFPSHKKISREAIRQVEILLIFFDGIRNQVSGFSDSLIISLSELHIALQKIRFLLQDCTREGGKLYILMKSMFIANDFHIVVRSIGTALDILRFDSLEISSEVRELLQLLTRQTRKAKLEPDPKDLCEMSRVNVLLSQFETEFEPRRIEVKRVLDYLGIRTWEECNREVKFLEEEMSNAEDEEEEREIPLLGNLLGFLCYSRALIFETLEKFDHRITNKQQPESTSMTMLSCLNPEDFRCPISLELMMDPVTTSTGQTYDRSSIQKWLKAGHMLCPKTGENLNSTELVPNVALKKLIHKFRSSNRVSISNSSSSKKTSPSLAYSESMRFLAQFLAGRLCYGSDDQQKKAAYEIRLLTKSNIFNRSVIIEMGNVPPLLDLLTTLDPETQENAIAALLNLSKHAKGQRAIIKQGGLILIISVVRRGFKMESRQIAAATIFYLSSVDRYRKLIGSTREGFPALMELIKDGTLSGKKNSLAAIFGLLIYHGNHERVLEAGIVPLLVDLIASNNGRSDLLADSLAVLASLAEKIEGCIAILQTKALPLIMELVKSSISRPGKEYCVSILLSLCKNGGTEVIAILAKESALMTSFYSLIVDRNSNVCKKALTLINMLQEFHESSSSTLAAVYPLQKERIVRSWLSSMKQ